MKKIFYIILLSCVCFFASAAETAHAEASARFAEAMRLRAESGESSEVSDSLFTQAADLFESSAREDWRFWFEAGNARWWAGDGAGAVIAYRRYLARDPFNPRVWHNLSRARTLAGTIPPSGERFLGWPWHLWLASLAALLLGSAALLFAFFLFFRKRPLLRSSVAAGIFALAAALSCAGSVLLSRPQAVILTETQGRRGDSAVYAPLPAEPLKRGQEVRILGSRDTWSRVVVGTVECWVPTASLEAIH